MTEFQVGDRVVIDRAAEIFRHGPRPRFDRALYRAWGRVRATHPRLEVEWFDIPGGKSRGAHGAGISAEYLIHMHKVSTGDYVAETAVSIAKRLADMRGHKGTDDAPEAVRSNPVDSQGGSSLIRPGDLVATVGDSLFPEGVRARVRQVSPGMLRVAWLDEVSPEVRAVDGGWTEARFRKVENMTENNDALLKDDSAGRGAALAHGDRQKAYGHPKVSFDRIGNFWSTYLSAPEVDPENLTAEDVGHMMNLLKISRSITDKGDDTIDDIEGYVTCIRMIRQAEKTAL